MADSKKSKRVLQKSKPAGKTIAQRGEPDSFYQQKPAWNFNSCDKEMWALSETNAGKYFWSEILPYLKDLETRTWNEILLMAKKENHSTNVTDLNPCAQKRLAEKRIEQDSIISLHINSTHRIYGYILDFVFYILWFDPFHGDNDTCVCRSRKKHT